ncbi:MAG: hypothetical protein KIT09_20385, partial [Bryobacteraceae bacterium]|nr:hypothetical protein [Bryobacteraceae bacterium]
MTATTAGGSLIHKDAVPDQANEYEVKTTLRLKNSGGYYVQYLGATPDARLGPTSAGTFVAVEMNPTISGGACSLSLA